MRNALVFEKDPVQGVPPRKATCCAARPARGVRYSTLRAMTGYSSLSIGHKVSVGTHSRGIWAHHNDWGFATWWTKHVVPGQLGSSKM